MSLKNLLDLRKKVSPQVQIIERIIFQKRSWKKEALRTFMVALVATAVIYGVSKADNIIPSNTQVNPTKNFSAIGTVLNIATSTLSIDNAHGSDDKSQTTYTFDTSSVLKIETKNYVPLTLSDLNLGDRIVVQGTEDSGVISIKRIISFSATSSKEKTDTATSTATTTLLVATSTSTTTDETSTTTPTLGDKIGDIINKVIDSFSGTTTEKVIDVQNVVNENSTSSASTTDEATTSIQVATTTPEETGTSTDTTPPTLVQQVIQVVTDTVNKVVDAVTPDPKPETPPQPDPAPVAPANDAPAN